MPTAPRVLAASGNAIARETGLLGAGSTVGRTGKIATTRRRPTAPPLDEARGFMDRYLGAVIVHSQTVRHRSGRRLRTLFGLRLDGPGAAAATSVASARRSGPQAGSRSEHVAP